MRGIHSLNLWTCPRKRKTTAHSSPCFSASGSGYTLQATRGAWAFRYYPSRVDENNPSTYNEIFTAFKKLHMKLNSIVLLTCILLTAYWPAVSAQSNITRIEYYIDNDPGYGSATSVSFTPGTNVSNVVIPFNPASVAEGIHTLSVRAKDGSDNWSLQNSTIFYKPYTVSTPAAQPNITKLEYFIDTDPGYGLATNVNVTASTNIANIIIPINPTALTTGMHIMVTRSRDANGNWSLQNSTLFYKPYTLSTPGAQPSITRIEYFIDTDPGLGLATNVTITPNTNIGNLVIPVNPLLLSPGLHTFVTRARDANGNWSLQNSTMLYKPYTPPVTTALSNIVKVEYYFDYDPGYGNGINVPITSGTNLSNLVIPIDPYPLTVCSHNFYVRAKDANGQWSLINATPVIVDMTISVRFFIQGYYAGNETMTTVLNNEGVQSGPCSEVDSVDVELHNSSSPYAKSYAYRGVLRTDGILPCKFPASVNGQLFYIVIRHRNGVQVWSADPMLMSQTAHYDFSTSADKAYGNNQVQVDSTVWAFYSGDFNQDENVDLLDLAILEMDINDFQYGYFATDINGDGNVDLLDNPLVENNINNFVFSVHP